MSRQYSLKADSRAEAGKGAARALRRQNKIPAVIYGDEKTPVNISFDERTLTQEYGKGHMFTSLCDLDVSGNKHLVLARDIQLHPISDRIIHADFMRVTPKTKLRVEVPVHFANQENCKGLKEKGVLNIVMHAVEMICVATQIPEHIEVDMTPFELGDVVKISHVKLPEGAKLTVTDEDFTIASIVVPRALVEEAPAAAATTADGAAAAPAAGAEGAKAGAAAPAKAGAAAPAKGAAAAKAPAGDKGKK